MPVRFDIADLLRVATMDSRHECWYGINCLPLLQVFVDSDSPEVLLEVDWLRSSAVGSFTLSDELLPGPVSAVGTLASESVMVDHLGMIDPYSTANRRKRFACDSRTRLVQL